MKDVCHKVINHIENYPNAKAQDILKLIYQNEYGCGHLVKDITIAEERLVDEYNQTEKADIPLFEDIGNGFVRINLAKAKLLNIPAKLIAKLFFITAKYQHGSSQFFIDKANSLCELCSNGTLPFSFDEIEDLVTTAKDNGFAPFSHTSEYHEAYKPAYRVIYKKFEPILTLMTQLYNESLNKKIVVAIDGRCGAGKTTLANTLNEVFDCPTIHMDDFFLPMELRTPERFSEVGGNIHYERFLDEVSVNLKSSDNFSYGKFNCSTMQVSNQIQVDSTSKLIVVEGSYSMHPLLKDFYDITVFCDVKPEVQRERIIKRNGEEMYKIFETKWIPLEEKYMVTVSDTSYSLFL